MADVIPYIDGRPAAHYRLQARDHGIVLRYGTGPDRCDYLGARDVWVYEFDDIYYMHYDGAGPKGWLVCLATSKDLVHWKAQGPVLNLGKPGSDDSRSASYGTVYHDGAKWYMFYLGTPQVTPAPYFIPGFPYLTMEAESSSPIGPWKKLYDITPFKTKHRSYYSGSASPGYIIKIGNEFRMLFSASTTNPIMRTLSYARSTSLEKPWVVDKKPLLPPREQVENSSVYYQYDDSTWFVFTDHVGMTGQLEYTDAIWVYWTKNLNYVNPKNKAVVLDSSNCNWSKIIGLPSVIKVGNKLAIFYDGNDTGTIPAGFASHMRRDIGLAWLQLPIELPK